ncbi:alpha/beta fold hydrolase [Streptomyces sp. NPDC014776]|uniref:alpha/beta fold hydrolase n=1 Tax=unclassified Streptomyces TaxID=2593676 RepID=UPI0036F883AA
MSVDWQLRQTGPADGRDTVLLLPGGMCSARSYADVMAQPGLAGLRLVAVTLPGQAGTPPPDDCSVERYAELTAELADEVGADVVVGFSMGAVVALEMIVSGAFTGPAVLLGVSISPADEPAFFRALARAGDVLGGLPAAVLAKGAAAMAGRADLPPQRRAELRADFAKNVPRHVQPGLRAYLRWLHRHEQRAERLCAAGVPTWVVHAEKGDGGLTDEERRVLTACPHIRVVTLPGAVFFLPNEVPGRIADIILEAAARVRR